jgi:hypothetical protein
VRFAFHFPPGINIELIVGNVKGISIFPGNNRRRIREGKELRTGEFFYSLLLLGDIF